MGVRETFGERTPAPPLAPRSAGARSASVGDCGARGPGRSARFLSASMRAGSTLCTSPTMPRSAHRDRGVLVLVDRDDVLRSFMPTGAGSRPRCEGQVDGRLTVLPVWPTWWRVGDHPRRRWPAGAGRAVQELGHLLMRGSCPPSRAPAHRRRQLPLVELRAGALLHAGARRCALRCGTGRRGWGCDDGRRGTPGGVDAKDWPGSHRCRPQGKVKRAVTTRVPPKPGCWVLSSPSRQPGDVGEHGAVEFDRQAPATSRPS